MCAQNLSSHVVGSTGLSEADAQRITSRVQHDLNIHFRHASKNFPVVGFIESLSSRCPDYGSLSTDAKIWCAEVAGTLAARDISADWVIGLISSAISAIRQDCRDLSFTQKIHLEEILLRSQEILLALLPTLPSSFEGEVAEVVSEGNEIAVVRLLVDPEMQWLPGQFTSVHSHLQPGIWRDYAIATPPNERGEVELHVQRRGVCSRLLMTSQPGDRWNLTPGQGGFVSEASPRSYEEVYARDANRIYVAHATGFAPIQSLLLDQLQQGIQRAAQVYVSADYPGQLYPLMNLWQYAATAPWLNVTPMTRQAQDAWWVEPSPSASPPPGLPLPQLGEAGDMLAAFGAWENHDIFLAGPREFVQHTRRQLRGGGTSAEQIFELNYDASGILQA
ncbi:MAG: FAD-binding oxidoreductase [Corynebacterium sp.]|nr:FAD-binding oxidoreductase [Corynebacterium sp.]